MCPTPEPSESTPAANQSDTARSFSLRVAGLNVSRSGKQILRELSFEVLPGEVYALLGANGAGKSTILLTLLGLLRPTSGSVHVNELNVIHHLEKIRRLAAYLPETATLYPHLSAFDNLDYFLALAETPRDFTALEQVLDQVGLPASARDERLATYSKGMRQKVAIALAILRDAPILLLDEATSGLDPTAMDELNRLIRALADGGTTVLMVTHDVFGACQIADRIGILQAGRLAAALAAPKQGRIDPLAVNSALSERTALL